MLINLIAYLKKYNVKKRISYLTDIILGNLLLKRLRLFS